jgi:amidophosphoribosyltransferase
VRYLWGANFKTLERKACSFERIYFSRGSDAEIYQNVKP